MAYAAQSLNEDGILYKIAVACCNGPLSVFLPAVWVEACIQVLNADEAERTSKNGAEQQPNGSASYF